jgi:hypothetical protein
VHATLSGAALRQALDQNLPVDGSGTFSLLGSNRNYSWHRDLTSVWFQDHRVGIKVQATARADLPVGNMEFPIELQVLAEPVITADYVAKLQAAEVKVSSQDRRMRMAQAVGGVLDLIRSELESKLRDFKYDLRPLVAQAFDRIRAPIDLPLGDAKGCAVLRVLGIETGPTVLADGIEKDIAVVVAPTVTLPCNPGEGAQRLPPLANVASLTSGPFNVQVPIAARYDELARAMSLTFTDGKLYFSKEFPALYLEKPEVYASRDQLVLKLHINGVVEKYGIGRLNGDLYMVGHPTVVDNQLSVPDLQPTIETSSFLLKLKAAIDGDSIREQARAALHLDIGERMQAVRAKLSTDLSFGDNQGCVRAQVNKIEVQNVYAHPQYLRLYVQMNAQAQVLLPCPTSN